MKPLNREELIEKLAKCVTISASEAIIKEIEANERAKFKQKLYELDWANILRNAIAMRTGSWNFPQNIEMINAGDTILAALMVELKKCGVIA